MAAGGASADGSGMSVPWFGVVFAVAMLGCRLVLERWSRKRAIEEPVRQGLARGSAVAEFTHELMRERWLGMVGLALVLVVDRIFRISGGLLESRLVLAVVVTAIFAGRVWLRRSVG